MPILVPATIESCKCGITSCFVFSDGSKSENFASLKTGEEIIFKAYKKKKIVSGETDYCLDLLARHNMPRQMDEMDRDIAKHDAINGHGDETDAMPCIQAIEAS